MNQLILSSGTFVTSMIYTYLCGAKLNLYNQAGYSEQF